MTDLKANNATPGSGSAKEWLDLRNLRAYAAVSDRTLRQWIRRPCNPLPAVQVGRKLLVKRTDFDSWLKQHGRRRSADDLGGIVNEMVTTLKE